MNESSRPRYLPIAILSAVLAAAGCSGPDTASLIASAKSYLEKQDHKAAIIQLRNARQQAPDNPEVRLLLGKAFLDTGEALAAEAELRKAFDLKSSPEVVLPLIAQSLASQGEFRKLTSEFASPDVKDPKATAEIATFVAIASLAQGDIKQAQESLKAAIAAAPNLPRAHVVRAQLAARGRDYPGAEAALDSALALAPNHPEASVLKAELIAARGRSDEAIKLLETATAANPQILSVRFALLSTLVAQTKLDQAEATLATIKKLAPADFRTVYSDALVALAKGDAARARDLVQPLIAMKPDHLPSLFVSGLANYQLKSYAPAEEALRKVVAQAADNPGAHRALVATYLRSGRVSQAVEAVDGALRRMPNDPVLLRLAGESRIQTGNTGEASKFYERATVVDRDGDAARLRLAQIRLATGDSVRGLNDLERLSAEETTKIQADLALYTAHLRKGDFDKALAAVAAIEKKQPNTALAAELRGSVYAAKRQLKEARLHFARAHELDPKRISSARHLAMLDLQENKVADARARYEKMVTADPRDVVPLVALAEIQALSGAPAADVKATLDRAVTANPKASAPRLALVTHYRRIGDRKGALEAARIAAVTLPDEPLIVELYGTTQVATGEVALARETFLRLAQLLPQHPGPWLRIAETHRVARDYVSALDAQRRALALQPDHAPALAALANTYLAAGRPDEAIGEARKMQREKPKAALGFALEAEVLASQKKFAEAVTPMREAIARAPTPTAAVQLFALLRAAGRDSEAKTFADRWMKEHPKDAAFLSLVGQHRQAARDPAGAASAYRAALEIDPDNVVVLNNLAWLLNDQGRPEARDLAERAHRIAPLNPSVVDTLGMVLLRQGDAARSVSMLRMATNLAPQDPRLRLNLARALAKSGDKAGAKSEVEQVMRREPRASVKAEAEQLLREL